MNRNSERGVALILTMILLVIISVMGISLAFISKTETWSSMNYRLMSQARDGAEAGINTTANYLMGATFSPLPTTYYTLPGSVSDPLTAYNYQTAYPVQNGAGNTSGHDVVLSANSVSSNYPVNSVQSTFNTNGVGKGSFSAGNTTVKYATSAKLLAMQQLGASLYNPTATTLQTWEITSEGTIASTQAADEQITAVLERPAVPVFGYAAFATDNGCNALNFGGGGTTDSYNSGTAVPSGSTPTTAATDGNVGTNGNLDTVGNTTIINGNLSTPRAGVGNCSSSNVTAWTNTNGNQVNGSIIQLPQAVVIPTPPLPSPLPGTTNVTLNTGPCPVSNCTVVGGSAPGYAFTGGAIDSTTGTCTGTPTTFDNITVNGTTALHLSAGCYNFNTLTLSGQATIYIDSGPVVLNVAGQNGSGGYYTGNTKVIDLTGGGLINNAGWDPSMFQILYAGSASVALQGGAKAVALLDAPNASLAFNSAGGSWYGAVLSNKLTDMGGASIHYDRKLKDKFYVPGPYMLSSFTWNKY